MLWIHSSFRLIRGKISRRHDQRPNLWPEAQDRSSPAAVNQLGQRRVHTKEMRNPPVAILGAGPSGLTLARLLEVTGIEYTVFERDDTASSARAGGTLDLHTGTGLQAIHEAGLFNEFKQYARYEAQPFIFADSQGNTLLKHGDDNGGSSNNFEGNEEQRPEIDRLDLRNLLLASIPTTRIKWGVRVSDVKQELNGALSVHSRNGTLGSGFELVVGADGAWSKSRALVTPAQPVYHGHYYLTTSLSPGSHFNPKAIGMIENGNFMAFGDGKQITAQPLRDGTISINVGIKLPEKWQFDNASLLADPDGVRQWLLQQQFANWAPAVSGLIKYSDGDFRPWPMYALPSATVPWKHVPGVTLIGDAAHLTLPNGEGVNIAMHDSVELARAIKKHGLDDLDAAVAEYERSMFPRAAEHIEDGPKMWNMLTAPDAPHGLLAMFAMTKENSD